MLVIKLGSVSQGKHKTRALCQEQKTKASDNVNISFVNLQAQEIVFSACESPVSLPQVSGSWFTVHDLPGKLSSIPPLLGNVVPVSSDAIHSSLQLPRLYVQCYYIPSRVSWCPIAHDLLAIGLLNLCDLIRNVCTVTSYHIIWRQMYY